MVRTRLNIGCRYSTPVRERPLHPTRGHFTPEPSQTQAPVTPATEPERRAGGSLTTGWVLAEGWWPYQRPSFVTPPFAGYVSGHSTFSRAAAWSGPLRSDSFRRPI